MAAVTTSQLSNVGRHPGIKGGSGYVSARERRASRAGARTGEIIRQWLYVLFDVCRDPLPWRKTVSRTTTGCKCAA